MIRELKPKLTTDEQIQHLLKKGVKFDKISIEEATSYLKKNNNYFKLRAYRKNFPQHPDGENSGKYIDLDFAMLKDLSIIDMRLRYTIIQLALDIEHFAKVKLIKAIEDSDDDGYQIVEDYFSELKCEDTKNGTHHYDTLKNDIHRNTGNPYCGGIIDNYENEMPIWAFVEVVPLGAFINFYRFCAEKLCSKSLEDDFFILRTIKELRNAAAHSNCLLHDMGSKDSKHTPNFKVLRALKNISKATKDNHLRNERMRQIVTLLYAHTVFVTSEGVHKHAQDLLVEFTNRLFYHIDYYENNGLIRANFNFLYNSIDILFPGAYNNTTRKK